MPSILNLKHRFAYFHTPKTGGSSVAEHLWRFAENSGFLCYNRITKSVRLDFEFLDAKTALFAPFRTPSEWEEILSEFWRDYFKFSFMRNPYEWLESAFWWHKNNASVLPFSHVKEVSPWVNIKDPYEAFEIFVETNTFPNQSHYLSDPERGILYNWVGDYDNIETEYKLLCIKYKFEYCRLHRNNARTHEQSKINLYRNDRVITKAECFLHEDIKLYKNLFNKIAEPEK